MQKAHTSPSIFPNKKSIISKFRSKDSIARMARAKLSYTCSSSLLLFLLLLILCTEITSTQGRAVMNMNRSGKCKRCSITHQAIKAAAMKIPSKEIDDEVEDYRPTTPGHSPGVGHHAPGPSTIGPDV